MKLTHFQALLLFALVISVAFAFLSRERIREQARYALLAFVAFVLIAIGFGWIMYAFAR
jgi:hypothetical protein